MRKATLSLDTLAVESFEPAPGGGDVPFAPTIDNCDTLEAGCQPYTYYAFVETCGYNISCRRFCAE